jgi:thiol-activated cytolysin
MASRICAWEHGLQSGRTMRGRTSTLSLTIIVCAACGAEIEGGAGDDVADERQEINSFILELPDLPVLGVEPKTPIECEDTEECPEDGQEGDVFCTYQRYKETGNYSEFIAFQPDSAALWPGSVLQGVDAQEGFFTPVGVERAPLTFSVSLENLTSTPVGRMSRPSLSQFREERNRILAAGVTGATPAAIDFEITEVHSSSQVSLALGASVLWPGGSSVTAGFNFDATDKRTKILVNYTQAYYTIDIDSPIEPVDFFAEGVTLDELKEFMDESNPPLYVQSITYGRRVVFTVESSETADKVRAALEAAYAASFDVNGKLELGYESTLKESRMHAFVLGGSGAEAAGAIAGFEGLLKYITRGGDYSKTSPGAPIAYKLAYLDNATTKLAFTTEYTERLCERNRALMHVDLMEIDHVGGGDVSGALELYGNVSVRVPVGDDVVVDCQTGGQVVDLWRLEDGQHIDLETGSTWTPSAPTYFDLTDVPVGPGQRICLTATFFEDDLFGDDLFGSFERVVAWESGWLGEHVLQPRGDGENALDVRIKIDME